MRDAEVWGILLYLFGPPAITASEYGVQLGLPADLKGTVESIVKLQKQVAIRVKGSAV